MRQRSWIMLRPSAAIAALACLALSTQFLFQRSLYRDWSAGDIALAWLRGLADLAIIAGSIVAALVLAGRIRAGHIALKAMLFVGALVAGAMLGEWAVLWLLWGDAPSIISDTVLTRALRWLPIGLLAGAIVLSRRRAAELGERLHEGEVERLGFEQQVLAIQLQTLQSQIEPHFLFNTLATIRRLQRIDPARGRETLSDFLHYLRCALPEMRARETTLGREVDLITAYLDVLRVRMGSRLLFVIDVPAALRDRLLPPLSLATLVENAIKHGLSDLPEGGKLTISASAERGELAIRVSDTGAGLRAPGGSGTGLANLRLRLRGLYGDAGMLVLAANTPHGLSATLRIPAVGARPVEANVDR